MVGMVDWHGYDGQQKFVMLVGHANCHTEASFFFAYYSLRYLDLQIWQFFCVTAMKTITTEPIHVWLHHSTNICYSEVCAP